MKNVVIIDYGLGNLNSVANALEFIGCNPLISNKEEDIKNADSIILPGVGAFENGMANLNELGLIDILNREVLENGKPILGICLGFQLFANESEENGIFKGLGWIDGEVTKLKSGKLRIPHIGWNNITTKNNFNLFKEIPDDNFYFVHSFAFQNIREENVITSTCNYGVDFVSSLKKGNIFGTQFHPEKSHASGLKVLKNFVNFKSDD